MEKEDWKPFRNTWDKSERKEFDDIFDSPLLYLPACSNSVQLIPLHPIIMSILFHHYKEIIQCTSEVEQIEARISKHRRLTIKVEEEEEEEENKVGIATNDYC